MYKIPEFNGLNNYINKLFYGVFIVLKINVKYSILIYNFEYIGTEEFRKYLILRLLLLL